MQNARNGDMEADVLPLNYSRNLFVYSNVQYV
jgi:hypothetical protein